MCVLLFVCVRLFLAPGVKTQIHPSRASTFAWSNGEKWDGRLENAHSRTHRSVPGVRLTVHEGQPTVWIILGCGLIVISVVFGGAQVPPNVKNRNTCNEEADVCSNTST